jgi:hypothetical protein
VVQEAQVKVQKVEHHQPLHSQALQVFLRTAVGVVHLMVRQAGRQVVLGVAALKMPQQQAEQQAAQIQTPVGLVLR